MTQLNTNIIERAEVTIADYFKSNVQITSRGISQMMKDLFGSHVWEEHYVALECLVQKNILTKVTSTVRPAVYSIN